MKALHSFVYPNQEDKSGKAPYASVTSKNYSTNEQRDFDGALAVKRRFRLKTYLDRIKKYFNKK